MLIERYDVPRVKKDGPLARVLIDYKNSKTIEQKTVKAAGMENCSLCPGQFKLNSQTQSS